MIEKIIVFGGGTSGWLTAAYLTNNLPEQVKICLIEDSKKGPIGVGEGTQPATASFLYECGLQPHEWMPASNATFKHGVKLEGWNDEPYFVDNDDPINYLATPDLFANKHFADKSYKEFLDWYPAYQLAENNISPKLTKDLDCNFNTGPEGFGAVHFDAYKIIDCIKKLILNRITYVDTEIVDIRSDVNGISFLKDKEGTIYEADLYIDCTGFESLLLENELKEEFISFKTWLPNDSAVALQTQYTDPKTECHPYTKATAMNAGWRWTIPVYDRIGNGYVYSSNFITPEEAEKELRDALGEYDAPAKHLKMKCGTHQRVAVKNVLAVGLSAGFVEPLEATGITFTTSIVRAFVHFIQMSQGNWSDEVKDAINQSYYGLNIEILSFIFAHYFFSNKKDTMYWQAIRNKTLKDLPDDCINIISTYYPYPKPIMFLTRQSMFSSVQWWSMIHAGGGYIDAEKNTPEEDMYLKYFIESKQKQTDLCKAIFPNHYEFLQSWYEGK